MALLKQSTAYTRMFLMVDSTDHVTGKTGLSPTVTLSKAGGAFGAAGGTVTEVSSGWYKIAFTTTDTNTLGELALHATGTAADPTDLVDQVIVLDLGINQTGDSYARLGAPAGASIAADIVTLDDFVDTEVAAIKTKTDFLPSATAGAAGGLFIAGSNAATTVNITGNLTGNVSGSVGSVTGAVGSVTGAVGSIATGGIAAASFAAGAINAAAIADGAIDAGAIADGAIDAATFAAGAIDSVAIATDAIDAASIKADAVTKIQAGLITTATTFDGVPFDDVIVSLMAVQFGVVTFSGGTYNFKERDAATTKVTMTMGAQPGVRTASSIS